MDSADPFVSCTWDVGFSQIPSSGIHVSRSQGLGDVPTDDLAVLVLVGERADQPVVLQFGARVLDRLGREPGLLATRASSASDSWAFFVEDVEDQSRACLRTSSRAPSGLEESSTSFADAPRSTAWVTGSSRPTSRSSIRNGGAVPRPDRLPATTCQWMSLSSWSSRANAMTARGMSRQAVEPSTEARAPAAVFLVEVADTDDRVAELVREVV